MRSTVLVCLCVVVVAAAAPQNTGGRKYTDKYDHVDVDAILRNDRILTSYVKCMLDQGPCTAEGKNLKIDLPDALETDCSKCSERQIEIVRKASRHLMEKRPADWKKLQDKYDPQGTFQPRFERFINEGAVKA
ncbi:ejaculatory bulb-specific protein 3-like [Neocloeon triangulifer]|uniref:ejaculatory bulb-specific protein 3-like n=1 Tax=Neocloeon triangulifer TaxID=2078957 RepID=UPI00286EE20C|nr:ejaculatory bulb-specific protein 3-like [Neocloeon triangulifer]